MLKLAADENFDNRIVHGLQRRSSAVDVVRVQDAGLTSADDPTVLAWAAREGRILMTHDVKTIPRFCFARVVAGESMPGVFEVPKSMPLGQAIEELLLLVDGSLEGEYEGKVFYLPL